MHVIVDRPTGARLLHIDSTAKALVGVERVLWTLARPFLLLCGMGLAVHPSWLTSDRLSGLVRRIDHKLAGLER